MNAADPTNESLMERVARGDREAFAELYERAAPKVFGMLMQLLKDRADAEETLQDVMLEVWRRAATYNPALAPPTAWMLMIARARGIDRLRKRVRTRDHLASFSATRDAFLSPEEIDDVDGPLGRAIRDLPSEQRDVLTLAHYRGLSRERIAEIEGVPVGTVKTRLRAAVTKLREALQETGVA